MTHPGTVMSFEEAVALAVTINQTPGWSARVRTQDGWDGGRFDPPLRVVHAYSAGPPPWLYVLSATTAWPDVQAHAAAQAAALRAAAAQPAAAQPAACDPELDPELDPDVAAVLGQSGAWSLTALRERLRGVPFPLSTPPGEEEMYD